MICFLFAYLNPPAVAQKRKRNHLWELIGLLKGPKQTCECWEVVNICIYHAPGHVCLCGMVWEYNEFLQTFKTRCWWCHKVRLSLQTSPPTNPVLKSHPQQGSLLRCRSEPWPSSQPVYKQHQHHCRDLFHKLTLTFENHVNYGNSNHF